jgi:hypothetical protein
VAAAKHFKAIIAQLRVFIDERPDHWWVHVTDIDHPGILFQIKAVTLEEAQERATAFVHQHLLPEVEGQEEELPLKLDWDRI